MSHLRRSPRVSKKERNIAIFIASDDESSTDEGGPRNQASQAKSSESFHPSSCTSSGGTLSQEVPQLPASNDLVKCILLMDQTKKPIKTAELAKVYGNQLNKELLNDARIRLRTVFGLDLMPIGEKTNAFYVVKTHPRKDRKAIRSKPTDLHDTFLTLILGFMMMQKKDSWMQFQDIEEFLGAINVDLDQEVFNGSSKHTMKELLTKTWVHQGYFTTRRNPTDEGSDKKMEYLWGQRARAEFNRREVLNFMAKIMKSTATDWKEQYKMIEREEDPDLAAAQERAAGVARTESLSQFTPSQARSSQAFQSQRSTHKTSKASSQRVLRERQPSQDDDEVQIADDPDVPSTSTGIRRSSRRGNGR